MYAVTLLFGQTDGVLIFQKFRLAIWNFGSLRFGRTVGEDWNDNYSISEQWNELIA